MKITEIKYDHELRQQDVNLKKKILACKVWPSLKKDVGQSPKVPPGNYFGFTMFLRKFGALRQNAE